MTHAGRAVGGNTVLETLSVPVSGDRPTYELGDFLRRQRAALVERWRVGRLGDSEPSGTTSAASSSQAATDLVDGLAEAVDGGMAGGRAVAAVQAAERYALQRLREGTALRQVVADVAGLRVAALDLWRQAHGSDVAGPALRLLNQVIDSVIAACAERYISARDRALQALDRISNVAFESRKVDDLLQRLLHVMVEPAVAVDTGSILLREGDALVVRAAVGLEEELRGGGFRLRIGEGFSGRIAAERRPRLLVDEEIEAETVSPVLKARRLRALYGVPLQTDGRLVGVAHIGSSTVATFSDQDRWLFEAMCARATAAISQHLLQEASEARLRELDTVLQSIPDAVFVADSRGVRHANRAALELLGADSVERLNRSAQSLSEVIEARHAETGVPLSPDERPIPRALRGEATAGEMIVRHLGTGRDVILRCAVAPIRSGNQIVGAVAACADITQRKREEAERDRAYREARQAVADRQHVLGVVSHDLRNPLNTILLAAEVLKDDGQPAERWNKGLAVISRAANRMNRMISDLLDINSIEAGRLALNPLPQDPLSVVDEVMEMFAPQAASRNLTLLKEAPDGLPLVRGDRHRLVQVLANLVSNALKVTAHGSVSIRLEQRGQEVVFAVIDAGPGIPEDARRGIFEPYWRAENATYKGTGLGLAIVRGIVEGHGGRVWIESEPGLGAAFLFAIPAA
jgi:PAS domain S-box-containing protein